MEVSMSTAMELIALVLLTIVSICSANVEKQPNHQDLRLAKLEKWKRIFEESQGQQDYPRIPNGYYQTGDRDTVANNIFEPDNKIRYSEYFSDHGPNKPYVGKDVRDLSSEVTFDQYPQDQLVYRTSFQSLCPIRREIVFLNQTGFEYRPDRYEQITCVHGFSKHQEYDPDKNKICSRGGDKWGYTCIEAKRTMYFTRRSHLTDCWESVTQLVSVGCECMWPKHYRGDIESFH